MTEKTIRRGTKLFDKVIDGAKNLVEYSLENGFIGKAIDLSKTKWTPRKELELAKRAMLSTHNGVSFTLRSHSNLWFSWEI